MGDLNVVQESPEGPSRQPGPHGPAHGHRHKWHFNFSEEERRVFAECKRESLLYRALPLAAINGTLTYAAVSKGYLKPNARFGAIPKVVLASILGYVIGKVSYRKVCMQKMMELPDSKIGQFLKTRQDHGCGPWSGYSNRENLMMVGVSPRDYYWGCGQLPANKASSTPEKSDA